MTRPQLVSLRRGNMKSRLIFALDVETLREAEEFVSVLAQEVGMFKIGKQLFLQAGPKAVEMVRKGGGGIFLDLKFHDVPHVVAKAGAEATRLGVDMFDLHALGSWEMMRRTLAEVNRVCRTEKRRRPKMLAVTVLTSLDYSDLQRVGIRGGVENQVVRLAILAQEAGMDGVVTSPHEVARIRKECGQNFLIVTPGIRPEWEGKDDQKRVMTPGEAMHAGADYLVIGRPIRDARDPVAAARNIVAEMTQAW